MNFFLVKEYPEKLSLLPDILKTRAKHILLDKRPRWLDAGRLYVRVRGWESAPHGAETADGGLG